MQRRAAGQEPEQRRFHLLRALEPLRRVELQGALHDAQVEAQFDAWWRTAAGSDAPLLVAGLEGVGKTWATLDWIKTRLDEHPVVMVIPSAAVAGLSASETGVKRFLADRLYELARVRDPEHWLRRLDLLFARPAGEGPVLTLLLDGMNQEPSAPWLLLLKRLQGPTCSGRVRVIAGTREFHLKTKLSNLRGLVVPPVVATVDVYDLDPGGELDQMLAFEDLTRDALHSDLIEIARTPRGRVATQAAYRHLGLLPPSRGDDLFSG